MTINGTEGKTILRRQTLCILLIATAGFALGCGDDDDTDTTGIDMDVGGDDMDIGGDDMGTSDSTMFTVTIENTATGFAYPASGVFDTPVGMDDPGPLPPGESYEITFRAAPRYPGQMNTTRLSFATMFVPSNDLFIAPAASGLPLFDDSDQPIMGDRSDEISVWDVGSEDDEPLGGTMVTSPNQKPHQAMDAEDVGDDDPVDMVRLASETYETVPDASEVLEVTVDAIETDREWVFTVTLTNVSAAATIDPTGPFGGAVPASPGVWVVHNQTDDDPGPLFTAGEADRDEGLEDIAEDGFPMALGATLASATGLTVVSSPGAWAVHADGEPIFSAGMADRGEGLEAIAEDGMATDLVSALEGAVAGSGGIGMMPIGPGGTFTFDIAANPGDRLSIATMVVPSNDLFFAFDPNGIELFESDGTPRSGEVNDTLVIWDAGTEVDQAPGVGLDQVHLQPEPDTGAGDPDDTVRLFEGDAFPAATDTLSVTLTPAS